MTKRIILGILAAFLLSAPAWATQGFPYGSSCSGGCGIGTHIVTGSINIILSDTNGGDAPIQGGTSLSDYTGLPSTIVPSQLEVFWDTDTNADGCVVYGALQNNSDRIQCEWADATHLHVGVHHHVTLKHLTPGSNGGPGGGPPTLYLTSDIGDSTGVFGGRYAPGQNSYPGPLNMTGTKTAYFNVYPPNPPAAFPLQWEITPAGQVTARRGHWVDIPMNLEWLGGNATSTAGFPTCNGGRLNQIGHTYQAGQPAATNSGTWYVCNGSAWISQGINLPAFAAATITVTNTGTGDVYNCPASASGGHNPSNPNTPTNTCTGTAGDLGASVTPFYAGAVGTSATDYLNVKYSSALGFYYFDANAASVPANAVPNAMTEFFPGSSAVTGTFTIDEYFTPYTGTSLTTQAAGTTQLHFSYTLTVSTDGTVSQMDPGSYPADSNLPGFFSNVSKKSIGSCSDATGGSGDSLDYFNLTQSYWMWLTFGAGDWGNYNIGNYDNARTFMGAQALFTRKMDGTAWPNWAATTVYGNAYGNMVVTDTNGHVWMATVNGGTSGSSITWPTTPTAGQLKTDNSQAWRYLGDAAYWNRCDENASMPFDNQVIQAGGSALWAQFTGAEEKNRQRTGDAIIKGTSTITGFYTKGENAQAFTDAWAGAFSPYSGGAGRGTAYELMALATFWKTSCDNGNCAAFTGNASATRMSIHLQNAILNWWDIHRNSNPVISDETLTYYPTFDPLHIGVGEEALIEWYIRDKELDPSNSLGLLDPRIAYEMQSFLDWMYFNWYNQCRVQGEGTDNFSLSYNPMDVQTCAILEPYFTELMGPVQPGYDWMARFNGNQLMSDSATTWYQAADSMRLNMYNGRTCTNLSCSVTGVAWGGGSGVPKLYGQVGKWAINDSWEYRYGYWTPFQDDLSPANNLCWDSGTMGCTGSHPYADTQQPYGVQIHANGSEQDDPTCENNFTGDAACSPIQNIHSTTADFRINIYEPVSSIRVDYGTTTACASGSSTTEETGYPLLRNSNNLLTEHLIKLSGLTPSTQYFARSCQTDNAGNMSCNPCASLGAFRGGGIKFTTGTQTALIILTTTLPSGNIGSSYSATLQGAGGSGSLIWAWTGTTPPGLSLNSSTGAITGTPTGSGGTYNFTVTLNDTAGDPPATAPLSIFISSVTPLVFTTSSPLPGGTQGSSYSETIVASGGTTPYTFSLLSAVPVNPGLSLNASTGVLSSATLSPSGNYSLLIKVTDSEVPPVSTNKFFALTITPSGSGITITTTSPLPGATAGLPYSEAFAATGGVSPLTWCVEENSTCDTGVNGALPSGLSLSPSGVLSGTALQSGTVSFTVFVSDVDNNSQSGVFSLTVTGTPLQISTPSLPGGTQGTPYSTFIQAVGGTTPYSWCIYETNGNCDDGTNGALPAGVALTIDSGYNGVISGTPTNSGTFGFTAQVSDTSGQMATKSLSIVITASAPPSLGISISPGTMSLTQGAEGQATVTTSINSTFNSTVSLSVIGLPTGATAAFSPNPIPSPGGGNSTLTIYAGPATNPGTYSLSVQASGLGMNPTAPLTLTVTKAAPVVRVITASLPTGSVLKLYPNLILKAVGGTAPYTWAVSPSLPFGMTLNSSTGLLSGIPRVPVNRNYIFTATDHASHQGSATLKLKITLFPGTTK